MHKRGKHEIYDFNFNTSAISNINSLYLYVNRDDLCCGLPDTLDAVTTIGLINKIPGADSLKVTESKGDVSVWKVGGLYAPHDSEIVMTAEQATLLIDNLEKKVRITRDSDIGDYIACNDSEKVESATCSVCGSIQYVQRSDVLFRICFVSTDEDGNPYT